MTQPQYNAYVEACRKAGVQVRQQRRGYPQMHAQPSAACAAHYHYPPTYQQPTAAAALPYYGAPPSAPPLPADPHAQLTAAAAAPAGHSAYYVQTPGSTPRAYAPAGAPPHVMLAAPAEPIAAVRTRSNSLPRSFVQAPAPLPAKPEGPAAPYQQARADLGWPPGQVPVTVQLCYPVQAPILSMLHQQLNARHSGHFPADQGAAAAAPASAPGLALEHCAGSDSQSALPTPQAATAGAGDASWLTTFNNQVAVQNKLPNATPGTGLGIRSLGADRRYSLLDSSCMSGDGATVDCMTEGCAKQLGLSYAPRAGSETFALQEVSTPACWV